MKKGIIQLKTILVLLILSACNAFAQSKNERIVILQNTIDSLLLINEGLNRQIEIEKKNNSQLITINNELTRDKKKLDSLLLISTSTFSATKNEFELLSKELKKTANSEEAISEIIELKQKTSFTKTIFTQNGREFFKEKNENLEYESIEYTYYFNSDSILYKVELSPLPLRYTLFSTIYLDFFGNVISIKHSTNEVGRSEESTTYYYDIYEYFFNPSLQFENFQHLLKTTEYCYIEDHNHDKEYDCDKSEILIRNRMFTNSADLLLMIGRAK